ncbi:MAG: tripartite tricarboxylate transporter substrate binding protein [Verrucomicrobiota bacterium]
MDVRPILKDKASMILLHPLAILLLALGFISCSGPSEDPAAWPTRPITISCLAAPGGGTDLVSRLMAEEMGKVLGVKINVVNRTEGGGAAAINHVAKSKRDGYQWGGFSELLLTKSVLGTSDATAKDWAFFAVAGSPGVLSVAPNSPHQSLDDLVEALRANPRSMKVGASIAGSVWHTKLLALERAAGVQFQFLPFQGSSPSQVAALTGEVDVVLTSISEQAELIKGDKLRPLAMIEMEPHEFNGATILAAGEKYPALAEVPVSQFLGLALPADTPAPILEKVTAAFEEVMALPALKETAKTRYLNLIGEHGETSLESNLAAEKVWTWKLYELGIAVKSPDEFGIAKP